MTPRRLSQATKLSAASRYEALCGVRTLDLRRLADESFLVADQFLDLNACRQMASEVRARYLAQNMSAAGVSRASVAHAQRGDFTLWLEPQSTTGALALFLLRMNVLCEQLREELHLPMRGSEFHAAVYPVGAFYARHCDLFRQTLPGQARRYVSCVYYLNEAWAESAGGELVLHLATGPQRILPVENRLVLFLSEHLEHEVLPAQRERMSLTGWFLSL